MRSGSEALSLLAAPAILHVLQALEEEPTPLPELRRALGHPPVTTMRTHLRRLADLDLIERRREDRLPRFGQLCDGPCGRGSSGGKDMFAEWLSAEPEAPVKLGTVASKSAVKALAGGWSSGIVRALAARPLALTELNRVIPQLSYPSLERRLTAMRQIGLVQIAPDADGRVSRCEVTGWLRHAVGPLSAAVGWEARYIPERVPAPGRIDAESALLLAVPLLDLPLDLQGVCRLAVEFRRGGKTDFAGITVEVSKGRVCSFAPRIDGKPDAWATGSVIGWFRWLQEIDGSRIEVGGESALASAVTEGLRDALRPLPSGGWV